MALLVVSGSIGKLSFGKILKVEQFAFHILTFRDPSALAALNFNTK